MVNTNHKLSCSETIFPLHPENSSKVYGEVNIRWCLYDEYLSFVLFVRGSYSTPILPSILSPQVS